MSVDFSQFQAFKDKLEHITNEEMNTLCEKCTKELSKQLITRVIKRTPVGDYSVEKEVTAKRDSSKHRKGEKYTVRSNPSGKMGGTLRRGWIVKTQSEAESGKGSPNVGQINQYVEGLTITHAGVNHSVNIINPVEYASYVENGHSQTPGRYVPAIGKRLKNSWVPGQFMLATAEDETRQVMDRVVEKEVNKFFKERL